MSSKSIFTSDRERRLWLLTLFVVVGIYSTLGLAPKLTGALRERNLLNAAFIAGMLLIGIAIVVQGLKLQPRGIEIGVALGVIGVYCLVFVRMGIPEERTHLIEYSLVAALVYQALNERLRNSRLVLKPAVLALVITAFFGILDEVIQSLLPNRVFDIRDVGFNALAALMAVAASLALAWARSRWGSKVHPDQ